MGLIMCNFNKIWKDFGQGLSAAHQPCLSGCEIVILFSTLKFSWMSEPVPKQTIHLLVFFMHTRGFKFEACVRLRCGCRALFLVLWGLKDKIILCKYYNFHIKSSSSNQKVNFLFLNPKIYIFSSGKFWFEMSYYNCAWWTQVVICDIWLKIKQLPKVV